MQVCMKTWDKVVVCTSALIQTKNARPSFYETVTTRYFFIRNWGYRGQNFKKLEGYITQTRRSWLVANLRNSIFGVHEIHNFCIDSLPNVPKVIY